MMEGRAEAAIDVAVVVVGVDAAGATARSAALGREIR